MVNPKKFIRAFENKVSDTIRKCKLFTKKDLVLVACSGGKDSTAAIYILKKKGYNVQAVTVDAAIGNYTKKNLENLRDFCKNIDVKLSVISFRQEFGRSLCYIRQCLASKGIRLNSCSICGVLRRHLLNKTAKKMKADFLATGHNLDDEAQSIMMNLLRNQLEVGARLGPKTGSINKEAFTQRVKPLYYCSEKDVIKYSRIMRFPVNYSPCPCRTSSYRNKVRLMLDRLEKRNLGIKLNIIQSFSSMLPKLREKRPKSSQMFCRLCNEPSKQDICGACSIIKSLSS